MDTRNLAVSKLNEIVEQGRQSAIRGLTALKEEYDKRKDYIVQPDALDVEVVDGAPRLWLGPDAGPNPYANGYTLTPHSRSQLFARAALPTAYADTLLSHGLDGLLVDSLRALFPKVSKEGIMVRTVGPLAKGVLSSSYRRMDNSPIFDSYAEQSLATGLVPYRGEVSDTRAFLSFLRPEVEEIFPDEHVVIGTELRSSDYGRGALELELTVLRLLCANGMVGMDFLRKVHLGKRFDASEFESGGPVIQLSARTMELDSATVVSGLSDAMKALPGHITALGATLRERAAQGMTQNQALALLKKKGISKEVAEKAAALYDAPVGVESLPEEKGAWRWANTISLLANAEKDVDKAADLRDVAFALAFGERPSLAAA